MPKELFPFLLKDPTPGSLVQYTRFGILIPNKDMLSPAAIYCSVYKTYDDDMLGNIGRLKKHS